MFVIGQFSNACNIDDLEDMRERMKAENSMLVIGGKEKRLLLLLSLLLLFYFSHSQRESHLRHSQVCLTHVYQLERGYWFK